MKLWLREQAFLWLWGCRRFVWCRTLLRLHQPAVPQRGVVQREHRARIVEIVLPVLVIIVMGYAIGRLWNKARHAGGESSQPRFLGPFLVLANLSDKSVDLVSLAGRWWWHRS